MSARKISVKNPQAYWSKTVEELQKLTHGHLQAVLEGSRVRHIHRCSCGPGYNCFDDMDPTPGMMEFNINQEALKDRVLAALRTKLPHIDTRHQHVAKREKKAMAY